MATGHGGPLDQIPDRGLIHRAIGERLRELRLLRRLARLSREMNEAEEIRRANIKALDAALADVHGSKDNSDSEVTP